MIIIIIMYNCVSEEKREMCVCEREYGKNAKQHIVQRVNGSTKANSDLDINAHNAIIMIMIKSCDDNSVSALYI